ncbi:MAG: dihydrofolate reductase family protein [SAR324 cluster bacterium]|nr:dihydrofolate reductase family protein [SAR324 cluster bacterium]
MKASVQIATSLDGFIARLDGGLDWLPGADGKEPESGVLMKVGTTEEPEDFGFVAFMNSVDHLVMGRNTFELVVSFGEWPYPMPVTVITSTLKKLPEVFAGKGLDIDFSSSSPLEIYENLERAGRKHLYIDGGKTIQSFLNAGLIDEISINKIPVIIGSGIPLFGPLTADVKLEHLNTNSYANGFVSSHYKVKK